MRSDQGLEKAEKFIADNFTVMIDKIISEGGHVDSKSLFQIKSRSLKVSLHRIKQLKNQVQIMKRNLQLLCI